jgi:hypothetical protein
LGPVFTQRMLRALKAARKGLIFVAHRFTGVEVERLVGAVAV